MVDHTSNDSSPPPVDVESALFSQSQSSPRQEQGATTAVGAAASQQKQIVHGNGDDDHIAVGEKDNEEEEQEGVFYGNIMKRRKLFATLIILVGACASAAFLSMGIVSQNREQSVLFEQRANDITNSIEATWAQYELFGLWIQESCFRPTLITQEEAEETTAATTDINERNRLCSRERFSLLIKYVQSVGLEFKAASLFVNVTHADRPALEAESTDYYATNYPQVNYTGFVGFLPDEETGGLELGPQTEQSFYFPVHYMEPVAGNEAALDLDLYSHPARRQAILDATSSFKPVVTSRIRLAQETDPNAFSVLSFHPGIPLDFLEGALPTVLSSMVIRIPDLIERAAMDSTVGIAVSIFDSTEAKQQSDDPDAPLPVFLGGADIFVDGAGVATAAPALNASLADIQKSAGRYEQRTIRVADRTWTIAVTPHEGTFEASPIFVVLGGAIIAAASIILAFLYCSNMERLTQMQKLKAQAESEKATVILDAAKKQAMSERTLNEYIAHEVRNPLCSAIAALSFVAAATQETNICEETRTRMKDDVAIVDASLQFINDLLRNMLDMHRAADNHLKVTMAPTDIRRDVLEPVAAILHLRGNKVKVLIDCPDTLIVESDRMRVKQIVLNLAINSSKFVVQGYIRLRAEVVSGHVRVCLEDSGPGIPLQKRSAMFAKYQESLDALAQGTGLGLCLCKHLAVLLGGDIWLDETFDSGIEGYPGTKFVLDLSRGPMDSGEELLQWQSSPEEFVRAASTSFQKDADNSELGRSARSSARLPDVLSILFVDDDLIIRRLFCRAVKRIAPGWKVTEAANGETACLMCKTTLYDVIFMDQYMASVEKQLLGTETVRALRAQGVTSKICGLSANNMEEGFLDAGATCFLQKPFPCEKDELRRALIRVWHGNHTTTDEDDVLGS